MFDGGCRGGESKVRSYRWCYHTYMGVSKRSVSLDEDVASAVEQAADEEGMSFSAWLSDAAQHRLRIREGLKAVQEWEAEAGPLTAEERAAGEALLNRLLGTESVSAKRPA